MSTKEKLIERFKIIPSDFTFDELVRLLGAFGYDLSNKGATSGSRVEFVKRGDDSIIIHRPHPGNIVKRCYLKQIQYRLKAKKLI